MPLCVNTNLVCPLGLCTVVEEGALHRRANNSQTLSCFQLIGQGQHAGLLNVLLCIHAHQDQDLGPNQSEYKHCYCNWDMGLYSKRTGNDLPSMAQDRTDLNTLMSVKIPHDMFSTRVRVNYESEFYLECLQ